MHYTRVRTQSDCEGALVSVFCAVWHLQKNKERLLKSHYINLRRQTLPVRMIYIFDNGDTPPDWLDADVFVFSGPLTIYEAWSAGVAFNNSFYVMNLNLDDRLAVNAVQFMLGAACTSSARLVSGEWLISFDESHLDEAFKMPLMAVADIQPEWPPTPRANVRLGSGTGERATFGPATMWHAAAVGKYYPSYFADGSPIKSIGDGIFWDIFARKSLPTTRIPLVIGKYYSNPTDQAEFRPHADYDLVERVGVSDVSFADKILSGEVPEV